MKTMRIEMGQDSWFWLEGVAFAIFFLEQYKGNVLEGEILSTLNFKGLYR
jgi:hypothetical protein